MKIRKIKRPLGTHTSTPNRSSRTTSASGSTLRADRNGKRQVDSTAERLRTVLLLNPERFWLAWWVDDPEDTRLIVDICLSPLRVDDGWTYVDLELDPVRQETELSKSKTAMSSRRRAAMAGSHQVRLG